MRICRARNPGFTMVEIMIVVGIIGLLAAVAVPSWRRARENAQIHSIANNLRLMEAAKAQYALENRASTGQAVGLGELTPYLKNTSIPTAVAEETYSIGGSGTVGDLVQADYSGTLAGKSSPLTITSFD